MDRYGAVDLAVETKADATPVSEADRGAEETVRARLASERPEDAVVGEEYGSSSSGPGARRWIIDPIDGTKNYVRGIPVWATLLALQEAGEARVAVVSAPALARRWWAAQGKGAFVRDAQGERRLRVSERERAGRRPGLVRRPRGVAHVGAARGDAGARRALQPQPRPGGLLVLHARRRGSGRDRDSILSASLWDLAALQLIVEEAGGRFTDLAGRRTADGGDAIATNGLLHDAALAVIGRTG